MLRKIKNMDHALEAWLVPVDAHRYFLCERSGVAVLLFDGLFQSIDFKFGHRPAVQRENMYLANATAPSTSTKSTSSMPIAMPQGPLIIPSRIIPYMARSVRCGANEAVFSRTRVDAHQVAKTA